MALTASVHSVPGAERTSPVSKTILTLSDATFDETIGGADTPVLVDFWAEWCVPCHTLTPIVESVAEHFAGRLKVGKMNVEQNDDVPVKYDVRSLPTLLLLKGGQVAEQRLGLVSKENLIKLVEPHL
jgi:thioredoxin 1